MLRRVVVNVLTIFCLWMFMSIRCSPSLFPCLDLVCSRLSVYLHMYALSPCLDDVRWRNARQGPTVASDFLRRRETTAVRQRHLHHRHRDMYVDTQQGQQAGGKGRKENNSTSRRCRSFCRPPWFMLLAVAGAPAAKTQCDFVSSLSQGDAWWLLPLRCFLTYGQEKFISHQRHELKAASVDNWVRSDFFVLLLWFVPPVFFLWRVQSMGRLYSVNLSRELEPFMEGRLVNNEVRTNTPVVKPV